MRDQRAKDQERARLAAQADHEREIARMEAERLLLEERRRVAEAQRPNTSSAGDSMGGETQCNQSDKQQNSDTEVLDVEASTDSALPNKFREFWGQNICALRLRTTNAGVTPCTWLRLEHCNISGVTLSECIYLREKKYGRPVNLRKPWNFVGNDSMMAKDAD
ncbi:hypothetical protein MTO96_034040, partial [Rhipicephalus appendiculatus]